MTAHGDDTGFTDSVPQLYDRYLVPLIFEPYAADLASRVALRPPSRVLEVAAGTGVATRHLATALPPGVSITTTDLNQPMLNQAAAAGTARPVEWRQADAMLLPLADEAFDAVLCQFAVMFFDRPRAFREARRVLRPGGYFLFSVWDHIEENDFADVVTRAMEARFPDDPPRFLARTPHGHHDVAALAHDLACGGFDRTPEACTLAVRSRAESPWVPAVAYCQGTPLRNEIEARAPSRLAEVTQIAAEALARRFGAGLVDGKIQGHVITIER